MIITRIFNLLSKSLFTLTTEQSSTQKATKFSANYLEALFPAAKHLLDKLKPIPHREEISWVEPSFSQAPWAKNFLGIQEDGNWVTDPINGWLEDFVKDKAFKDLPVNTKIELPGREGTAVYRVHSRIEKEGLVAIALAPEQDGLSPFLIFRGTQPDVIAGHQGLESVQNDLDHGLGERGWNSCKEALENLMNDPTFRNPKQKIKVSGFSLGGAHAELFIAEHFRNVSQGVFHSSPGISSAITDRFAKNLQNTPLEEPLSLQFFQIMGDPVPHFGERHLGCQARDSLLQTELFHIEFPEQDRFEIRLHSTRIFPSFPTTYKVTQYKDPEKLDRLLNNQRRNSISFVGELFRKIIGRPLFWIVEQGVLLIRKIKSFFS